MQSVFASTAPRCIRPEWTQRFAYRVMLAQPSLDSLSAAMLAEVAFDDAKNLEPEQAAESFADDWPESCP